MFDSIMNSVMRSVEKRRNKTVEYEEKNKKWIKKLDLKSILEEVKKQHLENEADVFLSKKTHHFPYGRNSSFTVNFVVLRKLINLIVAVLDGKYLYVTTVAAENSEDRIAIALEEDLVRNLSKRRSLDEFEEKELIKLSPYLDYLDSNKYHSEVKKDLLIGIGEEIGKTVFETFLRD